MLKEIFLTELARCTVPPNSFSFSPFLFHFLLHATSHFFFLMDNTLLLQIAKIILYLMQVFPFGIIFIRSF